MLHAAIMASLHTRPMAQQGEFQPALSTQIVLKPHKASGHYTCMGEVVRIMQRAAMALWVLAVC